MVLQDRAGAIDLLQIRTLSELEGCVDSLAVHPFAALPIQDAKAVLLVVCPLPFVRASVSPGVHTVTLFAELAFPRYFTRPGAFTGVELGDLGHLYAREGEILGLLGEKMRRR